MQMLKIEKESVKTELTQENKSVRTPVPNPKLRAYSGVNLDHILLESPTSKFEEEIFNTLKRFPHTGDYKVYKCLSVVYQNYYYDTFKNFTNITLIPCKVALLPKDVTIDSFKQSSSLYFAPGSFKRKKIDKSKYIQLGQCQYQDGEIYITYFGISYCIEIRSMKIILASTQDYLEFLEAIGCINLNLEKETLVKESIQVIGSSFCNVIDGEGAHIFTTPLTNPTPFFTYLCTTLLGHLTHYLRVKDIAKPLDSRFKSNVE